MNLIKIFAVYLICCGSLFAEGRVDNEAPEHNIHLDQAHHDDDVEARESEAEQERDEDME
ncbi:MAG: hypothetical protein ISQ32_02940 [Rickettsiales bacterium]|nr:hypothetical protein [Rickettsiales bacterium]